DGDRKMMTDGHVFVNNLAWNIPSKLLKPGDTIKVKVRNRSLTLVKVNLESMQPQVPDFLEMIGQEPPEARMTRLPTRGDVDPRIGEIREQLIIEVATR